MLKHSVLGFPAVTFVITSLAAGCGAGASGEVGTTISAVKKPKAKIAWMAAVTNNPYDNANLAGTVEVATKKKMSVTPFYSFFNPAIQTEQCDEVVESGEYDAINVLPVDALALIPCVAKAKERGIPVVATDLPIGPDPFTVEPQVPGVVGAVLTPGGKYGVELASLVVDFCQGVDPCNLVYIAGGFGITIDILALQKLGEVEQTHPHINVVATAEAFYDETLAYQAMQGFLQQTTDIQLVVASADQMIVGAEQALNEANLPNVQKLVGAGAGAMAVEKVRTGEWYATFIALPYSEGIIGTEMLVKALKGKKIKDPGQDPVVEAGLPAFMTGDNLDAFANFEAEWPR